MPQFDHLGSGKVLGVRLRHHQVLSADIEGKLVVTLGVHRAYALDQREDVLPFEIVRGWMSEQRFQRPQMRAVQCLALVRAWLWSALHIIVFHGYLSLAAAGRQVDRAASVSSLAAHKTDDV